VRRSAVLELVAAAFFNRIGRPVGTRQEFRAFICPKLDVGKREGNEIIRELVRDGILLSKNRHFLAMNDALGAPSGTKQAVRAVA
jgi:hypothetical protein